MTSPPKIRTNLTQHPTTALASGTLAGLIIKYARSSDNEIGFSAHDTQNSFSSQVASTIGGPDP